LVCSTSFGGGRKNVEVLNAVKFVLDKIGFNPVLGPIGQHDLTFSFDGQDLLGEIKGATKSASEGHVKQLHAKQTKYIEENRLDIKGVLIINAWRRFPPNERDNKERTIFPDDMMSLVNIYKFALIKSTQILEIYCRYLNKKLDKKKLATDIHTTVGPLAGYELKKD